MFTNKYLRKYFLKYLPFIIIGVATLVAVDYIQLFIPEFLGKITGIFSDSIALGGFTDEMKADVLRSSGNLPIQRRAPYPQGNPRSPPCRPRGS